MTKKEMASIVAMVVEQLQAVPTNITKVAVEQAAGVPTGLLDAARWLKSNKDFAKSAVKVVFTIHEKAVYFYLADSKGKRLGEKNRQLRRSSEGYYSIPFGNHALTNTKTVSL